MVHITVVVQSTFYFMSLKKKSLASGGFLCYINVILQLSHLPMKQDAVVQRVPDEDSNIINRAADDLVG